MQTQTESADRTSANPVNSENDDPNHSTIFNPQDLNDNENNFPTFNLSEYPIEPSFNEMGDDVLNEILKQCLNNDIIIGELLQHYSNSFKDKQSQKGKLKKHFFYWIMILLSIITLGCFALPIFAVCFNKDMATIIASSVASVIEFLIAFLKLPKIVAEYLFDKDEDSAMAKFVSDTHKYALERTNHRK